MTMHEAAPLPHEKVMELLCAAQKGDEEAKDMLVTHNTALVKSVVKKYLGRGTEFEDLYQIGCLGLVKAIRNYDMRFQVRFSTYAVPMIAGEIKRFLRDDGMVKVSRSLKELAVRAIGVQEQLRQKNGCDPGIAQIAELLEEDPADIAAALDAVRPHMSIYEKVYDDGSEVTLLDQMQNAPQDGGIGVDRILLKELLSQLDAKERQLIILRYFQDKTQSEIAGILGVSQVQISRMESRILHKMRLAAQ